MRFARSACLKRRPVVFAPGPVPSVFLRTRYTSIVNAGRRTSERVAGRRNGGSPRADVGVPKEEARLQRWLVSGLTREPLKPGQNRIICSELDVLHGIADVVVATTNGTPTLAGWLRPSALGSVNLTTAKVLTRFKYGLYQPVSEVAAETGFSDKTVAEHLRSLEALGLIRRKGDKARLVRSTRTPFKEVMAFEVKVADWRHGLYQATHYRAFANKVALALPRKKAEAVAQQKDIFKLFGIGLVGIERPGILKWYIRPVRRNPVSPSRMLLGYVEILKRPQARALRANGRP